MKTRKHIVTGANSFVLAANNCTNVDVVIMCTSVTEVRNASLNTKGVFEAAQPIPGIAAIHLIKIDNVSNSLTARLQARTC